MRKIIESTFVSLDGSISDPQEWSPPYWDEEHGSYSAKLIEGVDAMLLGRETYEGFAEAWMSRAGDPLADHFNAMPKHVATRTQTELIWNATPLQGDAVEAVKALKEQDGGAIIKYGTGSFSRELLEHKLVDEYHFWIFPVLAGGGTKLFDGEVDVTHLQLKDITKFESGIVVLTYTPKP